MGKAQLQAELTKRKVEPIVAGIVNACADAATKLILGDTEGAKNTVLNALESAFSPVIKIKYIII